MIIALGIYIAGALWYSSHTAVYRLFRSSGGAHVSYEKALVLDVKGETFHPDNGNGVITGSQDIDIKIITGEISGTKLEIRNFLNYSSNFPLKAGDRIVVRVDFANNSYYNVTMYSIDRGPALYGLALLFFILLCVVGGRRGLRSVPGIIFTFISIVFIFIPMLYRGYSPMLAAALVTALTVCVSFILLDDLNVKTVSAILGSISGLAVAAILAFIFQNLTMVSGYTTPEADYLFSISSHTGMKMGELLFAAVLIASLGAIMDIAISMASAVCEISAFNPGLSRSELFRSGMNVGRDMMGMMANTLILALTGALLNTVILIYSLGYSYFQILNSNAIVIDVIEALMGCVAVVLTVPAVAFITANLYIRSFSKNCRV